MWEQKSISFMDYNAQKKIAKILSIVSFVLLILVLLLIAETPTASGYELSIYDVYPCYLWIFFIGAIFSGILILILEVFNEKKTNYWIFGFFVILIGNIILLLFPLFRGYCFYGGASADLFSHMGWIKEISLLGHVGNDNFYPIIHIFIQSTSDVLSISVSNVIRFVPVLFSVLYTPFMFLLARSVSENNSQALLITSFSFPLLFSFFHLTIHPAFFSFIFLPLLIYLYYKRTYFKRKIEITILILILCFFIVFFHPITTLFSIIIFSTFISSAFLLRKIKSFLYNSIVGIKKHTATNIVLILTLSFFAWYTSYGLGLRSIKSIYQNLVYGSEFTIATHYISTLSKANPTVFQSISLFILRYGTITFYSVVAFFFIILISKKLFFSQRIKESEISYSILLVAIFLLTIAMIVSNFIVGNPIRVMRFFLMIATVFNGLIIYSILEKSKKQKKSTKKENTLLFKAWKYKIYFVNSFKKRINKKIILSFLIIILLFFSSGVCVYNVYSSPITWETNRQFTYMNFAGSAWMTENRDIYIQISGDVGFNVERMEHYMKGVTEGKFRLKKDSFGTPTHFGYETNDTLAQVFNYTVTYLITTENGRQAIHSFPINIQQSARQWTEEDFIKLKADQTLDQIYSNGEFEVWRVNAK